MLSQDYNLDPSVKRNATLVCKELFDIKTDDEVVVTKRIPEVEILKVAAVYDNMTAMKYEEPPLSEITALRHLLDKENGFDQPAVRALVESINILQPGVAVELSNGDRGLVITEGPIDILRPFVLSFRDNQVLNLSDESAGDIEIKDVMKTMDNRHVVAKDMLQNYIGEEVHIGEGSPKKHFKSKFICFTILSRRRRSVEGQLCILLSDLAIQSRSMKEPDIILVFPPLQHWQMNIIFL